MTLQYRCDAFNAVYAKWPASHRVKALFPEIYEHGSTWRTRAILHAFSGSIDDSGYYTRCDSIQPAELRCRVEDIASHITGRPFQLILADPPYSTPAAKKYGTAMVNRGAVTRALAEVAAPGAFLVWLDTCWPMHRKVEWRTVGRIALTRSTNHRVRDITIFERQALLAREAGA